MIKPRTPNNLNEDCIPRMGPKSVPMIRPLVRGQPRAGVLVALETFAVTALTFALRSDIFRDPGLYLMSLSCAKRAGCCCLECPETTGHGALPIYTSYPTTTGSPMQPKSTRKQTKPMLTLSCEFPRLGYSWRCFNHSPMCLK